MKKQRLIFFFIFTIILSFAFLTPEIGYCEDDPTPDHPEASKDPQAMGHKAKKLARQALRIYKKVKDKTWDQLSDKQKAFAQKHGITNAEQFDAWKAQQAALLAAQKAQAQLKIYKLVKDKEWSELTNKELAYAEKNGITTKEQYDAWKAQEAALLAQATGGEHPADASDKKDWRALHSKRPAQ